MPSATALRFVHQRANFLLDLGDSDLFGLCEFAQLRTDFG